MLRKLLVSLIVLSLIGLALLFVVSKTGLVEIPILSALVYQLPQPSRLVSPGTSIEDELQTQLISTLQSKLQNDTISDANVTLIFSEATLTAALRQAIGQGAESIFVKDASQVALLKNGQAEFYLPFVQKAGSSVLLVRVLPSLKEGSLAFSVTQAQIGQLPFPGFTRSIVQWPLDKLVVQVNEWLKNYASVESITMQEGSVSLDGTMTLDLKSLIKTE